MTFLDAYDTMEKLKKIFFSETFCFVIVLTSVIGLVIAALVFLFCSSWKFSGTIDETIIGQFGDFVGGVIVTIYFSILPAKK